MKSLGYAVLIVALVILSTFAVFHTESSGQAIALTCAQSPQEKLQKEFDALNQHIQQLRDQETALTNEFLTYQAEQSTLETEITFYQREIEAAHKEQERLRAIIETSKGSAGSQRQWRDAQRTEENAQQELSQRTARLQELTEALAEHNTVLQLEETKTALQLAFEQQTELENQLKACQQKPRCPPKKGE